MLTFPTYIRRFVVPLWPWYAGGFVLLAAVNLINLEIPQLAKGVINDLASDARLDESRQLALSIIGLGCLMIVIRTFSRILIFWPGRRIEATTKSVLFAKAMQLEEAFFQRVGMGDLISRLGNDVTQLRIFFAFGLLQIMNVLFLTVFTLAKMASVHLTLTLLSLVPLLAMFIVSRYAMPKMQTSSRENQRAVGDLTNRVTEAFVNVHVIQANAARDAFTRRFAAENTRVYDTNMQMVYVRTLLFPLMTCLAGASQLVILIYGGWQVTIGKLTVGDILAFNVYIGLLTFPLTAMGMIMAVYQRAKTALERLGAIDEATPEGRRLANTGPMATPQQGVLLEIKDLSYAFPEATAGRRALDGLSLTLTAGKRIGLFGKVGSGKSTLFNILTRLYDPPPGTVFFQGRDILDYDPRTLRQAIGYAQQTVHLFSASIEDNLTFGLEPAPPRPALEAAAAGAQVLGEINAFDRGWATEIGEKGVRLSGGQKQRLALARLLLRQPQLLLLDDVLSAVDHTTERRMIEHIHSLGCAVLIASHRGSALKDCDEILILAAGRVVDRGPFSALAARHPELALDQ